jgi:hypothetical protein
MVVGCVLIARAARRFGRAQLAELMHGYTTTTYAQGTWWLGGSPRGSWKGGRTFWDFRGTWVLRSNGEVVSPPTVNQEPPGLYPSPRNEGARELWTGCEWTNYLVSE